MLGNAQSHIELEGDLLQIKQNHFLVLVYIILLQVSGKHLSYQWLKQGRVSIKTQQLYNHLKTFILTKARRSPHYSVSRSQMCLIYTLVIQYSIFSYHGMSYFISVSTTHSNCLFLSP